MYKLEDFPPMKEYPYGDLLFSNLHKNRNLSTVNAELGSISNDGNTFTEIRTRIVKDREEFVKVFKRSIKDIMNLSTTAQKVLWYIMDNLKKEQGIVSINYNLCMEQCHFKTRKSIRDALIELLTKNIISKTVYISVFWVNPTFVFNGNRIEIKTNIVYDPL